MFKSPLTDKAILGAYMTGILPIKKYGTQSAVSDFKEFTMLTPKRLAKYVGFQEEVKQLCEKYDVDFAEMKRWYDGYSFYRMKSIYNPNSVIEAIRNGEFLSYWARTETYESLKIYIERNEDGLKEAIVQMLGGAHVPVEVETFRNDMISIKCKDDVLTLLIHLGYLAYDQSTKTAFIPNEEVRQEFVRAVMAGKHREIA
ncbi:MAG: AAA family ATPase [Lachnospiraceae bacterium]|nr:AAA family ATPase [Lachnospiraceae bacterium]